MNHSVDEMMHTFFRKLKIKWPILVRDCVPKNRNYPGQIFQALRMEVKKLTCKTDSEYIEVVNCSLQTPTKQLNVLYVHVIFIKEVKSLSAS
jgi:hypothetical protein